jgi:hypothetical protein
MALRIEIRSGSVPGAWKPEAATAVFTRSSSASVIASLRLFSMIEPACSFSMKMFGMSETTEASCFKATVLTVSVSVVSGLAVTASIARMTLAGVARVRAVWVRIETLDTPESTPTLGSAW